VKPNFNAGSGETGVTFTLTAMPGATGTPADSYAATEVSPALYESTPDITNLSGEFRIVATNAASEVFYVGYWRSTEARCYDYTYAAPVDLSSANAKLDQILAIISVENGSEAVTLTIKNTSGVAVGGATAFVTSDAEGTNLIIHDASSNNEGKMFLKLNPGTYYVWISHPTNTFNNPLSITVENV